MTKEVATKQANKFTFLFEYLLISTKQNDVLLLFNGVPIDAYNTPTVFIRRLFFLPNLLNFDLHF